MWTQRWRWRRSIPADTCGLSLRTSLLTWPWWETPPTHAHMDTCAHAHMHTCTHTCVHTHTRTCTHAHRHTHNHTHAHAHTHTYIYIYTHPVYLQHFVLRSPSVVSRMLKSKKLVSVQHTPKFTPANIIMQNLFEDSLHDFARVRRVAHQPPWLPLSPPPPPPTLLSWLLCYNTLYNSACMWTCLR